MGNRVFNHPADHGSEVTNLALCFGPLTIRIKSLALGPQVQEKYGRFHLRMMALGDHRLFGSGHAADRGTELPPLPYGLPGAHTLDPGHFLGHFFIRNPQDFTARRSCGRKVSLELHGRNHIGISAVAVFRRHGGVKKVIARGQYDWTRLPGLSLAVSD